MSPRVKNTTCCELISSIFVRIHCVTLCIGCSSAEIDARTTNKHAFNSAMRVSMMVTINSAGRKYSRNTTKFRGSPGFSGSRIALPIKPTDTATMATSTVGQAARLGRGRLARFTFSRILPRQNSTITDRNDSV